MTFIAPQAKLLKHLDRIQDLQYNGTTDAPINAEIDLSNRCSLGCEWCHFAYTHTRGPLKGAPKPADAVPGGDLMPLALALDIVRQLQEAGVKSITWTGGGEPTLHPDFDEIIGYPKLMQGLYTHGGHINQARADLLKDRLTWVYVSLDAADRDSYLLAKGVDRFDAACDGIRHLVRAEGPATVGVGYLVTSTNWQHVGRAAWLIDSLGADYIQFRPAIRYDQANLDGLAEDTAWVDDAINAISKASYYTANVEADLDRFRMYRDWRGHGYDTCWWSTLQTVITPNGMVWRCANKREHAGSLLGDLSREPFSEIWDRVTAGTVDDDCRVMCRGHLANQALTEILKPQLHPEFV